MKLNKALSDLFPGLGKVKRYMKAIIDAKKSEKNSYSQHQEDLFICDLLKGFDKEEGIYLDIGANHPTSISNTYKLYRKGFSGITVEPNMELVKLHKKFRPRDKQIAVGCGNENGIMKFTYSKTPVLSSFKESEVKNVWKYDFLPVFTADTIIFSFDINKIYLLSIDVEGLDYEVLLGCETLLKITDIACIEANNTQEEQRIKKFMSENDFQLIKQFSCNYLFRNNALQK